MKLMMGEMLRQACCTVTPVLVIEEVERVLDLACEWVASLEAQA